jgi:hypothetical protein
MNILILTPMEIEREKALKALAKIPNLQNDYQVIVSGIGRESTAKTLMQLPKHDICVLLGFAAIVGKESNLPDELQFGKPIEITEATLYGYEGGLFENGTPITTEPKTTLPVLASLPRSRANPFAW